MIKMYEKSTNWILWIWLGLMVLSWFTGNWWTLEDSSYVLLFLCFTQLRIISLKLSLNSSILAYRIGVKVDELEEVINE